MNQVVLIGRIVRDVELKMLEKGSIMNFTLAVDRGYKDKDGNKQTDFIPIVAFNKDKIDKIANKVKNKELEVVEVNKVNKKKYSPALYDLTELQLDANRLFGFSAG